MNKKASGWGPLWILEQDFKFRETCFYCQH